MQAQPYPERARQLPDTPHHVAELGGAAMTTVGVGMMEIMSQEGYGRGVAAAGLCLTAASSIVSRIRGSHESEPNS